MTATPKPPRSAVLDRLVRWAAAKPILATALLLSAGLAAAAITVSYTTSSTITTGVIAAPVQFVAGDDAGPSSLTSFVTAYAISSNKTYVTATVKGVPEASMAIDSFVKLSNVDGASRTVTLTTSQISNAYVGAYTLQVYNPGNALQDTLTLTAASPSATFTIPAGETFRGKLTLTLLTGAGADNVALTPSISMTVV